MAHVRAQVLAASRSRTGWLENNTNNSGHLPYISDMKTNFDDKMQEKAEKKNSPGSKGDVTRRKGTRVSTIANMFQSLSPHKGDSMQKSEVSKDGSKVYPKKACSDTIYGGKEFGRPERHIISDSHYNSISSLSRSESHLTRFNNARAMFERLQKETKQSSKSTSHIASKTSTRNASNTEVLKPSSPLSDVSSHSSFTPSPVSSSEDSASATTAKLPNSAANPSSGNSINNYVSSEKRVTNEDKLTDNANSLETPDKAGQEVIAQKEFQNKEIEKEQNSVEKDISATNDSIHCNGESQITSCNCAFVNSAFSPSENEAAMLEVSTSLSSDVVDELLSEHPLSSVTSPAFHSTSSNQVNGPQSVCAEQVRLKSSDEVNETVVNDVVKESEAISVSVNSDCLQNIEQEELSENKESNKQSDSSKTSEEPEVTVNNAPSCANLPTTGSDETNSDKPLQLLSNGYISSLANSSELRYNDDNTMDKLSEKQYNKSCAITNEYDSDEILRVTDGMIEIVPHDSLQSPSKSQLFLPNLSGQLRTRGIFGRHNLFPDPSEFTQELARRTKESSISDGIVKNIDDCDLSSWLNSQNAAYKDWDKEYEASEPSTDHEDSQVGSPYETGGSLRDAAGETLAEFECREHELFLVEAVLGSDEQGCQSGPFPSPPAERITSVDGVELMTQEEADKLLSKSSHQSLLSDEEAQEVVLLLTRQRAASNSDLSETSGSLSAPSSMYEAGEEEDLAGEAICDASFPSGTSVIYEDVEYHFLSDGHYFTEQPGLNVESDEDDKGDYYNLLPSKKTKVKFSTEPIKVFSTHSVEDYDRRNDEVDPVSASAEYELEKRIEKMDVFPVDIVKGPEGLGLSIIGMGVGADAGLEKLGIFVKTVTEGGAAFRDSRIQVSDQIIEVDGKSLVGVTQAYAASVLRNTSGMVRFLIGREKDVANSEIAHLISQSLQTDRERAQQHAMGRTNERMHQEEIGQGGDNSSVSQGSTPEEGEDGPTVEVFDLANDSSDSMSPDTDFETLKVKLREAQYRNAVAEAELRKVKEKLMALERIESERMEFLKQLEAAQLQLHEAERTLQATCQEMEHYRRTLEESQGQYHAIERKYLKAKKLIKEFQMREQDFIHQEEYHIQQLQEKDQEYNALVKALKDRVILLEHNLTETQKTAGMPIQLPYNNNMKQSIPQIKDTVIRGRVTATKSLVRKLEIDVSDGELSDNELAKYVISPDDDDDEESSKRSTVERKPLREDCFDTAVPQTELLDTSAAKAKAELASKGSLANRQPPTLKKQSSCNSMDACSPGERRNSDSSLCEDSEDELILRFQTTGNLEDTNLKDGNSENVFVLMTERIQYSTSDTPSVDLDRSKSPSFSPVTTHPKPMTFVEEIKAAVRERQAKAWRKAMMAEDGEGDDYYTTSTTVSSRYPENSYPHEHLINDNSNVSEEHVSEEKGSVETNDVSWSNCNSPPKVNLSLTSASDADEVSSCGDGKSILTGGGSLDTSNDIDYSQQEADIGSPETEERKISSPSRQKEEGIADKDRRSHHWQSGPVHQWTATQVGQWLLALGLDQYIPQFIESDVTGQILLQVDSARLKVLGVTSSTDRSLIKKKVKDMRSMLEKERKAHEKEQKAREKQQKKAEKAAKKK